MEIAKLKDASRDILHDINSLLVQLRNDSSQNRGTLEELRDVTSNRNVITMVARDGERIVGMGFLYPIIHVGRRTGHIEDVVVDSAYRGKGLGEKIMQALIDTARKRNLTALYLTSRPARVAANKLYQKLGFVGKKTNVYKLTL